ncbi:DUF4349 domain-containing protein [Aeromicrobium sp. 636]|uniref:DUF4349 domain-containing protein n=1 Tax=Aeromicrobium senzhongii TaxID=2663859 RepID=A0A8I0EYB5_9ACTN|nr:MULTISPECIES: DUF4349 domain-containing protein [Aeromicrobium]MBC9227555.1 DUF4349 domain-containing protein [Aeromicrobium senzhongii]MCQ3999652.1 DUF4349 domain-containing protein [Aeromicrobium sp. 636]
MTGTELPVLEPERIERMRVGVMDAVAEHEGATRHRRRRVRAAFAGAVAAAVVVVGGVGVGVSELGGSSSDSKANTADDTAAAEAPSARSDAGAEADDTAADAEVPPLTTVVTTGSMSVEVDDVRDAVAVIRTFVAGRLGRIDAETIEGGAEGSASLTVRVPADGVEALRRELDSLGAPSSVYLERTDEAATIADVDARIASLETSIRRLRAIIAESSSTRDLLDAEAQLTQRQGDLEALQGQRRALRDQTSLATIEVLVTPRDTARPVEPGEGFSGGLTRGWNALVATVDGLVTVAGLLTPWLIPVGLGAVVVLGVRRRARR